MILDRFIYLRAQSVADALRLAGQHPGAVLLAGGQSLLPAMKAGRSRPPVILDLGPLGGAGGALRYIRASGGRVTIGAMTRHVDIERSAMLRHDLPLLARAVSTVGDPQVRHRGTIGGSLAYGDPAADAAIALTALRAEIVVDGPSGRRVVAIDDFLGGGLRAAEIITEIQVPPATGAPWGFAKFSRKSFEWAIVSAAYQGTGPGVPVPGIALANMAPVTIRAAAAERAAAAGAPLREVARLADNESHPRTDSRATPEFRRHLSRVLLERAMLDARSGPSVRWASSPAMAHL